MSKTKKQKTENIVIFAVSPIYLGNEKDTESNAKIKEDAINNARKIAEKYQLNFTCHDKQENSKTAQEVKFKEETGLNLVLTPNFSPDEIGQLTIRYPSAHFFATAEDMTKAVPQPGMVFSRGGAGTNNFDTKTIEEKGAILTNTPGGNTEDSVDGVMAIIQYFHGGNKEVKKIHDLTIKDELTTDNLKPIYKDKWQEVKLNLPDKKVAVIGAGNIGSIAIKRFLSAGATVKVWDRTLSKQEENKLFQLEQYFNKTFPGNLIITRPNENRQAKDAITRTMQGADITSIHLAQNTETRGLIGKEQINAMNKGGVLINTARGQIINEKDTIEAVTQQKIKIAVDIDYFTDKSRKAPGQADAYIELARTRPKQVLVLPHVIADSIRNSREMVFSQSLRQILETALNKQVYNPVTKLPNGYKDMGSVKPENIETLMETLNNKLQQRSTSASTCNSLISAL